MADLNKPDELSDKATLIVLRIMAFFGSWGVLIFYIGKTGLKFGWIAGLIIALLVGFIADTTSGFKSGMGCIVILLAIFGVAAKVWL
jgi:hypothetical protein